jgi:hypothetical protein
MQTEKPCGLITFFILVCLGGWRWGGFELLNCPVIKKAFFDLHSLCFISYGYVKKVTITKYSDSTVYHVML